MEPVSKWTAQQVVDWMRGTALDSVVKFDKFDGKRPRSARGRSAGGRSAGGGPLGGGPLGGGPLGAAMISKGMIPNISHLSAEAAFHRPQELWSPQEGLDDSLQPYVPYFRQQEVAGERLLQLCHQELLSLGISRVGHQELLLEAVDLLCSLVSTCRRWFDEARASSTFSAREAVATETVPPECVRSRGNACAAAADLDLSDLPINLGVESDHLRTLVGRMRSASVQLQVSASERRKNPSYRGVNSQKPSNHFLTAVVELIANAKTLLGWLDRAPETGMRDLGATKNSIIQLCLELTSTVQKNCTVYEMEEKILEVSRALNIVCEGTVGATSDPVQNLVHNPASCLEVVSISNVRPGEGLGMYIKSTYDGLHVITGTTENTHRIHAGDEVVQVNGQTVVGWQLKHLVGSLKAQPGGVVLVLKKRPSGLSCTFSPAPLKNLRWRPPLVQMSGLNKPSEKKGLEHLVKAGKPGVLDLYIPPPPSVPYSPRGGNREVVMRPPSPNSSLDVGRGGRSLTLVDHDRRTSQGPSPNAPLLPTPVRMRQRSSTRGKPRPISMPAVTSSGVSDPFGRPGLYGRTAQDVLQRCLSNERIATISEEDPPCFPLPLPYQRGGSRGVDHIRGSRCFVNAELHNSATIPYQEAVGKKPPVATATAPPASSSSSLSGSKHGPSSSSSSSSRHSLLGGWLARLRLLSH
ncbi:hypothetical protein NHX12_026095 [Muraenolepis orangiensis]|uniref:Connector enhancer of kinase suppressor of ras 3 n=1 Tax=Muraenolepis orangiensis TaxID=630683 RepID=A0A9Q0EFX7_9TELE|nr:hypothetical protein NHX12_026095 [Muraenolepis orangiensis]